MFAQLNNLRFTIKLPAIIAGATLIVGLAMGLVSFVTAKDQTATLIEGRKVALLNAKKDELSSYLASIEQDLRVVASNQSWQLESHIYQTNS